MFVDAISEVSYDEYSRLANHHPQPFSTFFLLTSMVTNGSRQKWVRNVGVSVSPVSVHRFPPSTLAAWMGGAAGMVGGSMFDKCFGIWYHVVKINGKRFCTWGVRTMYQFGLAGHDL